MPAPLPNQTRLIPLCRWPDYHAWPTIGGLRHLALTRPAGIGRAILRVNGRVVIDEAAFLEWARAQSAADLAPRPHAQAAPCGR